MTSILPVPFEMQAIYDQQRLTAPFVLVRMVMLKTGELLTEEVWWDTRETCEALAVDEPPTDAVTPAEICEIKWVVKSRRAWQELLHTASLIDACDRPN
jgi:hypothetical protein